MIEKLKTPKSISWDNDADGCIQRHKIIADTISKINEIIDVINTSQSLQVKKAEPVDKFAEQKRWIGKLCKFWDEGDELYNYDILIGIMGDSEFPYRTDSESYDYCEPVSEDLIYKGE